MAGGSDSHGDSLPSRIWSIQDYYRAKDFYDKRGLIFNPALECGSPAAAHVLAQAQLRAAADDIRALEPVVDQPGHATRDKVFVSYSHKDKRFLDDFLDHLKPYVRSEAVSPWSDEQIQS